MPSENKLQKSLRIPEQRAAAIERWGRGVGLDFSGAANELLEQALRAQRFPGIVFTSGPGGRRATLRGSGVDIWEIVAGLRSLDGDTERLADAYDFLTEAQLRAALVYYDAFPEEIDERLEREAPWDSGALRDAHPPLVAETAARYRKKRS